VQPSADLSLEDWWNTSLAGLSKENRRSKAATLIYTAWNIWKARNRQVFDHLLPTPPQVLLEIKKEIALRKRARGDEEPFFNFYVKFSSCVRVCLFLHVINLY